MGENSQRTTTAHETRSETIWRHVHDMLHWTRAYDNGWAPNVVETYHALVPPMARRVIFKADGDPYRAIQTNTKRILRWFERDSSTNLPADLEEAIVLSLPEPWRTRCVADLARRYNLLAVPYPAQSGLDVPTLASITVHMGETLKTLAPVLEDSRIDEADVPHLPAAQRALEGLISDAKCLLHSVCGANTHD